MEITSFININTIILIGTLLVGVVYLVVLVRRGASQASLESNEILRKLLDDQRELLDDQKDEILKLRERQHQLGNDMQSIKLAFETIKQERKYLTKLVTLALSEHFATNPDAAKAAHALVMGEPLRVTKRRKGARE